MRSGPFRTALPLLRQERSVLFAFFFVSEARTLLRTRKPGLCLSTSELYLQAANLRNRPVPNFFEPVDGSEAQFDSYSSRVRHGDFFAYRKTDVMRVIVGSLSTKVRKYCVEHDNLCLTNLISDQPRFLHFRFRTTSCCSDRIRRFFQCLAFLIPYYRSI